MIKDFVFVFTKKSTSAPTPPIDGIITPTNAIHETKHLLLDAHFCCFRRFMAGNAGTLNTEFDSAGLATGAEPPPTCVKVPLANHRSSSAFRFLSISSFAFGLTSSRPWNGVNDITDVVPAPPPADPTPAARKPWPWRTVA